MSPNTVSVCSSHANQHHCLSRTTLLRSVRCNMTRHTLVHHSGTSCSSAVHVSIFSVNLSRYFRTTRRSRSFRYATSTEQTHCMLRIYHNCLNCTQITMYTLHHPRCHNVVNYTLHHPSPSRQVEPSVYLDGHRLRYEYHPSYLWVTLDHTLSYREHLTKTAGKLKNQNNLLMKLASSTWSASVNTLRMRTLFRG